MASTAPPPPAQRKTMTLVILAILLLLIIYLAYRCSKQPVGPPTVEPTPVEATVTEAPVTPVVSPMVTVVPPTPTWPPAQCQNWLVEVGPEPDDLSHDPICVGAQNSIRWKAKTGSTGLRIFFPASGFPSSTGADVAPFLGMHRDTSGGKDEWVFNNVSEPIYSGTPNPEFGKPGQKYAIKYWQSINGKTADGRIIIQR